MRAVISPQIGVICNAAMRTCKSPIIVDPSGQRMLAHVAGRDCVRVTPPTAAAQSGRPLDFKLEQFVKGVLTETVTLRAERGQYFVVGSSARSEARAR
jgi:hypothetical protein